MTSREIRSYESSRENSECQVTMEVAIGGLNFNGNGDGLWKGRYFDSSRIRRTRALLRVPGAQAASRLHSDHCTGLKPEHFG